MPPTSSRVDNAKIASIGIGVGAGLWLVLLFFVAMGTCCGALDDSSSKRLAENAYQSIQAAGKAQLPATRSADAKAINLIHDYQIKATGGHAAGYRWVKDHGNAIFVEQANPDHVLLYTHGPGAAVLRLSGDSHGNTDVHDVWSGTMGWWLMRDIALGEVGLLALILLALNAEGAHSRQAARRRQRRLQSQRTRTWLDVVGPNEVLGPADPESGFSLYSAQFVEHDGPNCATFGLLRKEWDGYEWHESRSGALPDEHIARGTSVEQISERWFDFCKRVSDLNVQAWAPERARRAELAKAERQVIEAGGLEGLLPPGHQLVRSIAETTLP